MLLPVVAKLCIHIPNDMLMRFYRIVLVFPRLLSLTPSSVVLPTCLIAALIAVRRGDFGSGNVNFGEVYFNAFGGTLCTTPQNHIYSFVSLCQACFFSHYSKWGYLELRPLLLIF